MTKDPLTVTIERDILEDFRELCEANGMKISTRIELLVKADVAVMKANPASQ